VDKLDEPRLGFPKDKDIDTYTFSATQILTPQFLVTGGYSLSRVDGYQSSPLRRIKVPPNPAFPDIGPVYDEVHPKTRDRKTGFLRIQRYFLSRTSVDLNLSYYFDDWGVDAGAVQFRVSHYLSDNLMIRLNYRFYSQSAAYFYKPHYTIQDIPASTPTDDTTLLRTADVRLRNFDAHTIGATLGILAFMDWSVYLGYDRYVETNNGLKAHIVELTIQIPY
jgi:hypothetical protein